MNKGNITNNAKTKISSFEWYVPHYTPSLEQQTILSDQIVKKMPTKLQYVVRCVFMKKLNTQNFWTSELGTQERLNIPVWIIVGFQQRDRQDSQNLNNKTFYRPPVTSTQCLIGYERDPDKSTLLNYDDDYYSQGYGLTKEVFRAPTKDDILQPYKSHNDFRSSNYDDNIGYNLYVFDTRYQKNFESAQPIKVEFKFSETIPAGIYGYALVLTNKLISISSDGERHFNLI